MQIIDFHSFLVDSSVKDCKSIIFNKNKKKLHVRKSSLLKILNIIKIIIQMNIQLQ